MTIPSRPAPPPPTSSTIQQSQNGGVITNTITNNTIKLPPPPGSKNFPINHSTTQNNYSSISAITATNVSSSSHNTIKSITRHFPTAKTRYAPATNWNGTAFDSMSTSNQDQYNSSNGATISNSVTGFDNKRIRPPRPPPPRLPGNNAGANIDGVLKKPGPPQSVNVLSNLFGRRIKANNNNLSKKAISSQILPNSTSQLLTTNENNTYHNNISISSSFSKHINNSSNIFETGFSSSSGENNEVQLISFDSPPNSPTFTQKSNSDCVSVDSFSSDSNFSSPNNGSVSQPESGFEDDFTARTTSPPDPWETLRNPISADSKISNISSGIGTGNNQTNYMTINELRSSPIGTSIVHPVRNINTVNKNQTDNHLCNGKSLLPPNPTLSMPTIIRPNKGLAPKPPIIMPKPNLSQQIRLQNHHPMTISNSALEDDPPMPTCPPPPPPSDIHCNDEYVEEGPAYGIALYSFDSAEDGDLNFRENEKIYLINKLNEEWYVGRTKSGCEGIFPSNYIDIKIPLKDIDQIKGNTESEKPSANTNEHKIKVLFNFEAEQPEDLTIFENDTVNVLYKINEDWLFGKIHNRYGQFPANFIEYVPTDLPLKMP